MWPLKVNFERNSQNKNITVRIIAWKAAVLTLLLHSKVSDYVEADLETRNSF